MSNDNLTLIKLQHGAAQHASTEALKNWLAWEQEYNQADIAEFGRVRFPLKANHLYITRELRERGEL